MSNNKPTTRQVNARFPIPWAPKTVYDRTRQKIKRWGSVWTHASDDQRSAYVSEVAFDFLTCRDDIQVTGLDARNLRTQILIYANLIDLD